MHFNLFCPILESTKGPPIINGIGENYAHCTLVVRLGDSFEPLLSGSIPDLHSYFFSVEGDGFDLKVDAWIRLCVTDGGEVRSHEVILAESKEYVSFADSAIPDNKEFDQVIIALISFHYQISKI